MVESSQKSQKRVKFIIFYPNTFHVQTFILTSRWELQSAFQDFCWTKLQLKKSNAISAHLQNSDCFFLTQQWLMVMIKSQLFSCFILLLFHGDVFAHGFVTAARRSAAHRPSLQLKTPKRNNNAASVVLVPLYQLYKTSKIDASFPVDLKATTANDPSCTKNDNKRSATAGKRILLVWVHLLSIFIAANYFRTSLYPAFLLQIQPPIWALTHSIGAMAFAGGVITTTLLEWNLPSLIDKTKLAPGSEVDKGGNGAMELLRWLFQIESNLVLPGVTMSLISGVVQSFQNYGTFRYAPLHVKSSLHVMLAYGAWWVIMDRRSQRDLLKGGKDGCSYGYDKNKLVKRRVANVVSCAFLLVLYGIMILKPGVSI